MSVPRSRRAKGKGKAEELDSGGERKDKLTASPNLDCDAPSDIDDTDNRAMNVSPCLSKMSGDHVNKNSMNSKKPAELFRTDLISAMKLPDTDQLQADEYYLINDTWKMEWEKGVQVPVKPDAVLHPSFRKIDDKYTCITSGDFKLPQRKLLHATHDDDYKQGNHELTGMHQLSEQVVRYDLDDLDVLWLQRVNEDRVELGFTEIHEWIMEKTLEEFENQCHEKMQETIKTAEGLGIEYDENIICDVCRSTESEDGNEMVFCDACDICVHQACYGIQTIPEGTWLCRTCALGLQPQCIFCPKTSGAMKSTRSGTKWSHVSCALWIPEVSIGCVEKMEPITKISNIPASRWALVCCICRDRMGACIQCSVKSCKTAFHVTCGFQNSLEMNTILEEADNDVKLKAYCPKHTKRKHGFTGDYSPNKDAPLTPSKLESMTSEERENLRQEKIKELEDEFYRVIKVTDVAAHLDIEEEVVDLIYNFWVLKRKVNFNRPLLMPKTEEADMLSKQQEDCLIARMKMFIHLRQDLERVRNLCYMVNRREKIRRQLYKFKEDIFHKQLDIINRERLTTRETRTIVDLNLAKDIYDQPALILKKAAEVTRIASDIYSSSSSSHTAGKSTANCLIARNKCTKVLSLDSSSSSSSKPTSQVVAVKPEPETTPSTPRPETPDKTNRGHKNIFDIVSNYDFSPRRSSRSSTSAFKSTEPTIKDESSLSLSAALVDGDLALNSPAIRADTVIEADDDDDEEELIIIDDDSPDKSEPKPKKPVVNGGNRRTFGRLSLKSRICNKYNRPKKTLLMNSVHRNQSNLEQFFKPITQNGATVKQRNNGSLSQQTKSRVSTTDENGDVFHNGDSSVVAGENVRSSRRISMRLSSTASVECVDVAASPAVVATRRRSLKRKRDSDIDVVTCDKDADEISIATSHGTTSPDRDLRNQRASRNNKDLDFMAEYRQLRRSSRTPSDFNGSSSICSGDQSDAEESDSSSIRARKRPRGKTEISDSESVSSSTRSSRNKLLSGLS
ncbi:protein Jade-3-like [Tubulanus polymorphus]|uniref:protein Jade-3-like n=1 Tax=Tubulanus polymorphus TaxID=672921 RepID=UPI003DA4416B